MGPVLVSLGLGMAPSIQELDRARLNAYKSVRAASAASDQSRARRSTAPDVFPSYVGLHLASRLYTSIGCRHMTLHAEDVPQNSSYPSHTKGYMPVYSCIIRFEQVF